MSGKSDFVHLQVEGGPDVGRRFTIPPGGARVGRSSGNDIMLADPALSRFHCRLYFKDNALWLSDLGSTNASLVNGLPASERPLRSGDILEFGDSRIRILEDKPEPGAADTPPAPPPLPGAPSDPAPAASSELVPPAPSDPATAAPSRVDLGFGKDGGAPSRPSSAKPSLVLIVLAVAAIAVGAAYWLLPSRNRNVPLKGGNTAAFQKDLFEFQYEWESATTSTVFRYVLTLQNNTLSAKIDDPANNRHVLRDKKPDPEALRNLREDLAKSAFFDMRSEYTGVPREGEWESRDLTLTLGARTHRVRVANRLDPDEFKPVREMLEMLAQNELSLTALTHPPEKLIEMARQALQLGYKYRDERDVRRDNLYNAIRTFESCMWHLETVEPKPEFFLEASNAAEETRKELAREYDALLFEADKAWNLNDWTRAAEYYSRILTLIPDRSDDRHQNALKRQIEVERRLRR